MKPKNLCSLAAGLFTVAALAGLLSGPAFADTIVTEWDDVALQAIRDVKPGPTIVARSVAIVHTAMFDAWAAYDANAVGTMLGDALRRPAPERTDANKHKAMSYAAYVALVDQFPSRKATFDQKMAALGYPLSLVANKNTAAGIGVVAANAVIEFRHRDGANQLGNLAPGGVPYADYTGYVPVNTHTDLIDPNRWQPLQVIGQPGCYGIANIQVFCTPQWGLVKPFAMKSGSQYRPTKGPATIDQPAYLIQAEEIIEYTRHLNDHTKVVAEYWADGPKTEFPPGHWAVFAKVVSNRDKHTMDQDVKLFFVMTNAMLDASIGSWDAKRHFDSVRPISAVRHLFKDKLIPTYDGKTVLGKDWFPYQFPLVVTPPFAEYTSGHSTYSRAGAEVLKAFTGSDHFGYSDTIGAGKSLVQPGVVPAKPVTLYWATFTDAADEAGISRRYGGIHFIQGDLDGRAMGEKIGKAAWKHAQKYFRDGKPRDHDD